MFYDKKFPSPLEVDRYLYNKTKEIGNKPIVSGPSRGR